MRIDGNAAVQTAVQAVTNAAPAQAPAQVAILKRALEAQKQEASELLKLLEPKGRVIDIRA